MYIEKKEHYDTSSNITVWETFSRYSYYSELEYVIDSIENVLWALNELVNNEYKDINDEEYYHIVNKLYNIEFNMTDVLRILSIINNKKYDKIQRLKTRVVGEVLQTEGHGRDFSWWNETRQLVLDLITPEGLVIDKNYNYSKEEIEDILNYYKVYLYKISTKPLGIFPDLDFEEEKQLDIDITRIQIDESGNFDEYYQIFSLDNIKCSDDKILEEIKKIGYKMVRRKVKPSSLLKYAKSILDCIKDDKQFYEEEILNCSFINDMEKDILLKRVNSLFKKQETLSLKLNK